MLVQIVGERFVILIVNHISGEKGYTPCSTFSCCLHYGDRRVDGGSEDALTDAWSLEQTTVTGDAVHLHMLVLEEHVVADLQHGNGCIEVGADEVGEVKLVACCAYEHRTTLLQSSDRLAREVVVCDESAAVGVAFESVIVELREDIAHIYVHAEQVGIFLEQRYPCVEV